MFKIVSLLTVLSISASLFAQYGTFDPEVIETFKSHNLSVVLDNGHTEYNDYIKQVMEGDWRLNKVDFISLNDFETMSMDPERSFLVKIKKADAQKHQAMFLALVNGWKKKAGNATVYGDHVTNVPVDSEVAFVMMDADKMEKDMEGPKLWLYMKSMADYMEQVQQGKISDKATADRLYDSRTRHLHEMQIVMTEAELDASVRDPKKLEEFYTKPYQIVGQDQLWGAIESEDKNLAIVDVVFTGEYKTRHCFKTIYNARTGEIMYKYDDASLHGKKQGLIDEDLKRLERAR